MSNGGLPVEKLESTYEYIVGSSKEHNILMCFPLKPVFTRDKRRLPNFIDEPTSNLDSLNEAVILKSLREEQHDKTIVLVSHRQSTMRIADIVYSVEQGRVS